MFRTPVTPERVRERLEQLAAEHGNSLAELSAFLGRNKAYLQQFVKRGTPRRLDEDDRLRLAQFFGVDERELGAREPWAPVDQPARKVARAGKWPGAEAAH
ncbi:helix-turn-helix domain-containing protein [Sphingomonas leidyi]|uniref:helix-turn-helix domain-containing protein n=1 Tax=Sphingomonas leidyi TaxID=68569 RepID=UPI0036D299B8